jgi:hypothetical protein
MKQRQGPLRVYLVEDSFIMGNLLKELIAGIGATVVGRSDSATIAIAEMAALDVDGRPARWRKPVRRSTKQSLP